MRTPMKPNHASPTLSNERIAVVALQDAGQVDRAVAEEIATLIRAKAQGGRTCVLGLATGSTPTGVYEQLVRMYRDEGLSFANVITFNLDEYYPMPPTSLQSYRRFMDEHLFSRVDLPPQNVHVPDGTVPRERVQAYCEEYE